MPSEDIANQILIKLAKLEERLISLEKQQKIYNDTNIKEHEELLSKINRLVGENDSTRLTNGKQNEQLVELTAQLQNYVASQEELQAQRENQEKKERAAFTWRISLTMSIVVFFGDLLLRLFGL